MKKDMKSKLTPWTLTGRTRLEISDEFYIGGLMKRPFTIPVGTRCVKLEGGKRDSWVVQDLSFIENKNSIAYHDAEHYGLRIPVNKICAISPVDEKEKKYLAIELVNIEAELKRRLSKKSIAHGFDGDIKLSVESEVFKKIQGVTADVDLDDFRSLISDEMHALIGQVQTHLESIAQQRTYKARLIGGEFFTEQGPEEGAVELDVVFPTLALAIASCNEFIKSTEGAVNSGDLDSATNSDALEIVEFQGGIEAKTIGLLTALHEAGMPSAADSATAHNFNDADRYNVSVESALILFLPITNFRPEMMRVSARTSGNDTWFEVESFNPRGNRWIELKSHESMQVAKEDAKGWYLDPAAPLANSAIPCVASFDAMHDREKKSSQQPSSEALQRTRSSSCDV